MGLEVRGIEYRDILKGIGFEVKKGEVCVVFGPNGAGKTTLLKCTGGLIHPEKGEVNFDGASLLSLSPSERAKWIAYLPQFPSVPFSYTVKEVVLMGRAPYHGIFSCPGREDERLCERVLEGLGCRHLMERDFLTLSGGERELVYLARALVQGASILLLDEPTSHLDFGHAVMVIEKIREETEKRNLVTVVALHNPWEVLSIADKVVVLKEGRKIAEGRPHEVLTASLFKELYEREVKLPWDSFTN
ncbi:ABC transporter ATP-binding protein [bacterium]|nr:MAG: ABC transporter ATP-binding protein [bacterium]